MANRRGSLTSPKLFPRDVTTRDVTSRGIGSAKRSAATRLRILSFAARNQAISRGAKVFYGFKEKWFMHLDTGDFARPTPSTGDVHE